MHFQQQLCINKCTYIKQHLSTQLASYGVYVQLYFILQLASQCIIKVMYLDIGRSIKQYWPLLFLDTYLQCTCYWSAKVISRNTTLIEKNTFHVWLCTNLVVLSGPPRGGGQLGQFSLGPTLLGAHTNQFHYSSVSPSTSS